MNKDTRRNLQVSTGVIGFVTMLLMAVWSGQASAADVGKRMIDGVWHITYDGRVEKGDAAKLVVMFEENPDIEWVSMNSGGGLAQEGAAIGQELDKYIMAARVRKGNICMSACANAFIGAHKYSVEGTLGFHSFRYGDYDGDGMTRIDKKEIRDSIYYAQSGASLDVYNIMLNGFSWDLYFDYTGKHGEFVEFNSNEELKEYYIGPMEFSNQYKNSRGDKEFYKFPVTKETKVTNEERKSFKSLGYHHFYTLEVMVGQSKVIYVEEGDTWEVAKETKFRYYLHKGRDKNGKYIPGEGWINKSSIKHIFN